MLPGLIPICIMFIASGQDQLTMLDEKSKGKEIVIGKALAPKHGQVIDLMEALKRSMERVPAKKRPAIAAATKKKKKVS